MKESAQKEAQAETYGKKAYVRERAKRSADREIREKGICKGTRKKKCGKRHGKKAYVGKRAKRSADREVREKGIGKGARRRKRGQRYTEKDICKEGQTTKIQVSGITAPWNLWAV